MREGEREIPREQKSERERCFKRVSKERDAFSVLEIETEREREVREF